MRRLALALVLVVALAAVPLAAAATPITGTVTVANGSADGAQVTVVPVTETLERAGDPARTTVRDGAFSVDVTEAPRYAVRVEHAGATHTELLRNRSHVAMNLSETVAGRVVDPDGEPRSGLSVELVDETGFVVATATTDANGTASFGPVEADERYRLRATVDGAPYRWTVDPTAPGTATLSVRPPTDDPSALQVPVDSQTGYVLQVIAPRNASGAPSVVQTVTLRNTADRPFVGSVALRVPTDATPYAAMVGGREAAYRRTAQGVRLNVTVPADGTTQVGAASDLAGPRVVSTPARDADSVAVVLRGYDPNAVDHSGNLRVGDAPVPLLTSDGPVAAGERLRVDLAGARTANASGGEADTGDTEGVAPSSAQNSIPPFPGASILGAVFGMVVLGLVGYRVAPGSEGRR